MALECYACCVYVGDDRLSFETMDIVEAATWCCETFMDKFDDNRFVCAHCLAIDTENGPTHFPFSFHRHLSMVVDDNNDAWSFVFEDVCSGKKLVSANELIEWTLSAAVV